MAIPVDGGTHGIAIDGMPGILLYLQYEFLLRSGLGVSLGSAAGGKQISVASRRRQRWRGYVKSRRRFASDDQSREARNPASRHKHDWFFTCLTSAGVENGLSTNF